MATAKISLPNGTIITVEGSVEEVEKIVSFYSEKSGFIDKAAKKAKRKKTSPKKEGKRKAQGPMYYIRELIKEGFFEKERTVNDIRDSLRQKKGIIYKSKDVSATVLRLLRNEELDRKQKDENFIYIKKKKL